MKGEEGVEGEGGVEGEWRGGRRAEEERASCQFKISTKTTSRVQVVSAVVWRLWFSSR